MSRPHEETLRRLAIGDRQLLDEVLAPDPNDTDTAICAKFAALIRLGAMVALDASSSDYQRVVASALAAGATVDEIVDALVIVAPETGAVRVVAAAPRLALAIGYDVDAAIECVGPDGGPHDGCRCQEVLATRNDGG
jgi:4-carboxymuconolactone decarboxylase